MGTIRTTVAALLTTLAIAAFQSDAYAQARRGESGSAGTSRSTSRSTNVTRTTPQNTKPSGTVSRSSSSDRKSAATKPSSQTRPSTATRPSTQTKPSATTRPPKQSRPSTATRPSTPTRPSVESDRKPSTTVTRPSTGSGNKLNKNDKPTAVKPATRPEGNRPSVTRPGNSTSDRPTAKPDNRNYRPSVRPDNRPSDRPAYRPDRPMQQIRPDRKPDVHRVHPRDRDFLSYSRPSYYWSHYDHCFGHRVRVLPAHVRRYVHFGITYYCYNDVWYRPYGGHYIVCRPPFGTALAANLIADMAWTAVKYSYYNTVYNTYSQINDNNRYIAEQNEIIAKNNATIAAQNQAIAMNQQLASQAYTLANELGLIQSYAAADSNYFYQDGIFYVMDSKGEYRTIAPPAGALVETLPEDYDMITLNGEEYYKVDDTVYKVTISDGKPYFEVLGQLYS